MTELIAVFTIALLATISPGPDFIMVTKNTIQFGKKAGIYTSLGISLAVLVHVAYTILGVGMLISQSIILFTILKTIGAGYLIYLGIKMLRSKSVSSKYTAVKTPDSTVDVKKMFRQGFICNVTNPKTTIFILSIFLQIIDKETPVGTQMLYGVLISFIHLIWFSFLTFGFSKIAKHRLADRMRNYIEKISGGVLVLLGVKLLASAKN